MSHEREAELATAFDTVRPHLIRVAYAVLGSRAEAEDVVADCWLRLPAADQRETVRDVEGWATVVVARAALDELRSARRRREAYPGPWLPEPVLEALTPEDSVTLDDSISYAVLVVLETLSPAERVAWVLHDLFGMPFDEVAATVGRSAPAVRQLAKRARDHVSSRAPRMDVAPSEHADAVRRFTVAATGGSLADLVAILDPGVVLTSDGGGEVTAARRPVRGPDRVARFLLGTLGQMAPDDTFETVAVNGSAGFVVRRAGIVTSVISLTVADGLVARIDILRAPVKLGRLDQSGER